MVADHLWWGKTSPWISPSSAPFDTVLLSIFSLLNATQAHILRHASSKTSAVTNISADHKWLVSGASLKLLLLHSYSWYHAFSHSILLSLLLQTGTPISTSINDLSNQLKFLGIQHSGEMMKEFNQNVCNNNGSARGRGRGSHSGSERPRIGSFTFLMRSIMMRHTQMMTYAGSETTLMSLPPKVSVWWLAPIKSLATKSACVQSTILLSRTYLLLTLARNDICFFVV